MRTEILQALLEHTPSEIYNANQQNLIQKTDEQHLTDSGFSQEHEILQDHGTAPTPAARRKIAEGQNFFLHKSPRFSTIPDHTHEFVEINYIYSGIVEQTIDGRTYTLKQGQIVMLDAGISHSVGYTNENDILIHLMIRKSFLTSNILSRLNAGRVNPQFIFNTLSPDNQEMNCLIFNTDQDTRFERLMDELINDFLFPSSNSQDMRELMLTSLLVELFTSRQIEIDISSLSRSSGFLLKALQYMEENYMTCTLESTAEHVGVNPNYLSTLIRKHTYQTYKEIIISYKMRDASEKLLYTRDTVDDIAQSVGYQNLTYFYRVFRDMFGCTPKQYRIKYFQEE